MKRYLVAATIVFGTFTPTALAALECKPAMPSGTKEYWSWRIIDGKRCWYPGRPGMDKSNLRWAQPELARAVRDDDRLENVRNFDELKAKPTNSPPDEMSFAERWPY